MESFNETIKNLLHFIALVQDACDKKRLLIEQQNKQAYDGFIKEWKKEKSIAVAKKAEVVPSQQEDCEVAVLEDELEEVALVDSLLEKARNIRLKAKTTTKRNENSVKSLLHGPPVTISTSKSSSLEPLKQKTLPRRTEDLYKRTAPRSKSASISAKLKPSTVPRSKSANVQNSLAKASNGIEKVIRSQTTSKLSHTSNGTHGVQNAVILSSTELQEYKKLNSSASSSKAISQVNVLNQEGSSKSLKLDVKQHQDHQNCYPSYRKFLNEFQGISISKSSFRVPNHRLWYPFLSLKCKKYLLNQPKCTSFDSLTKALKLIHQIQESLLWIDLLSLIGRDAVPKLHLLDERDRNAIRVCSYLDSIYNENLQRTPIIDQS